MLAETWREFMAQANARPMQRYFPPEVYDKIKPLLGSPSCETAFKAVKAQNPDKLVKDA
jgi:hypothetical protein